MSDGSPTLFERVLETAPDSNESTVVFPWHKGREVHDKSAFDESFTDGKVKQQSVNALFDDLKNSPYHNPDMPFNKKMKFILIAAIIFVVLMVPAWIILALDTDKLFWVYLGNFLVMLAVLSPAITIFGYSRAKRQRFEEREKDFKKRLIEHNRSNFITAGYPLKMSLFGAYFTMEKPNKIKEPAYGPLVTIGNKKLTAEERKFEAAYFDVSEGSQSGIVVPKRIQTRSGPEFLGGNNNNL